MLPVGLLSRGRWYVYDLMKGCLHMISDEDNDSRLHNIDCDRIEMYRTSMVAE